MSRAVPLAEKSPPRAAGARVIKYVAIRNHLMGRILSGEWQPGDRLPSEHDIMARFGVSRVTTRQALDMLRAEGRIEARRGKGYFVRAASAMAELDRLQSFGEMLAPLGVPLAADVIEIAELGPPPAVAEALGLAPLDVAIRLVRARLAAGATVCLDVSWFALALGRRLIQLDLARQDIFTLMETRLGLVISHADITLGVEPVPSEFCPVLGLEPGTNAALMTRTAFDAAGRALMVQHAHARPGLLRFHIRASR